MKNLKVSLLTVVLLFPVFCLFAQGGNTQKCAVKVTVSDVSYIDKVPKGTSIDSEDFINKYLSKLPPPDGMIIDKWKSSGGIDSATRTIVMDTAFFDALLITKEEWQSKQDSILWERLIPRVEQLLTDKQVPTEDNSGVNLWQWLLISAALVLSVLSAILSFLFHRMNKKQLRDNVVEIVQDSDRLRTWRDEADVKTSVVSNRSDNDGEIRELRRRVALLEDELKKVSSGSKTIEKSGHPQSVEEGQGTVNMKMLFADSIVNGKFNRVKELPSDDSIFELNLKGDSNASVTIFKQAYNKVLANPSYLEGCEKQMLGNTSVYIDREGTAEKDDNGKWKLINPLKVVLK